MNTIVPCKDDGAYRAYADSQSDCWYDDEDDAEEDGAQEAWLIGMLDQYRAHVAMSANYGYDEDDWRDIPF